MVTALLDHDMAVAQWVASHPPFNAARGFGNCTAIGWVEDDRLIAGTVFNNWEPEQRTIEMSTAAISPRWLTRQTLETMFGYVFDRCNCQMTYMRVSEKNQRMCSIARRFGFTGVLIRRMYGPEENGIVFTFTAEEWRSHRMRIAHGQAGRADPA